LDPLLLQERQHGIEAGVVHRGELVQGRGEGLVDGEVDRERCDFFLGGGLFSRLLRFFGGRIFSAGGQEQEQPDHEAL